MTTFTIIYSLTLDGATTATTLNLSVNKYSTPTYTPSTYLSYINGQVTSFNTTNKLVDLTLVFSLGTGANANKLIATLTIKDSATYTPTGGTATKINKASVTIPAETSIGFSSGATLSVDVTATSPKLTDTATATTALTTSGGGHDGGSTGGGSKDKKWYKSNTAIALYVILIFFGLGLLIVVLYFIFKRSTTPSMKTVSPSQPVFNSPVNNPSQLSTMPVANTSPVNVPESQ